MKKFELIRNTVEIPFIKKSTIKEGVTLANECDQYPEIIKSFSTMEEANEELKKYKSTIQELSSGGGKYYLVEEFYVEENTYDDDGDWLDGGNVWAFSKF